MKPDRKAQIDKLARDIQQSPGHDSDTFKQLVDFLFEEAKNKLVSSRGDDTLRHQGEAQAFSRLYALITRPPLNSTGE